MSPPVCSGTSIVTARSPWGPTSLTMEQPGRESTSSTESTCNGAPGPQTDCLWESTAATNTSSVVSAPSCRLDTTSRTVPKSQGALVCMKGTAGDISSTTTSSGQWRFARSRITRPTSSSSEQATKRAGDRSVCKVNACEKGSYPFFACGLEKKGYDPFSRRKGIGCAVDAL